MLTTITAVLPNGGYFTGRDHMNDLTFTLNALLLIRVERWMAGSV